jgi:hypothetical protein
MTQRVAGGQTFNFAYDAENRLVSVSGDATASFVYDGDGARILSTMDGATTIFPSTSGFDALRLNPPLRASAGSRYEKVGTSVTNEPG